MHRREWKGDRLGETLEVRGHLRTIGPDVAPHSPTVRLLEGRSEVVSNGGKPKQIRRA